MKKYTILWSIAILLLVLFWVGRVKEGFLAEPPQAPLPQPKQVSFISADASSSTTANPFLAQPDYRDWWNARDSFRYFLDIYTAEKAKKAQITEKANAMLLQAPQALSLIQAYIRNPESVPSRTILRDARTARILADQMRRIGSMNSSDVNPLYAKIQFKNDNLLA
jgi:hypothetical protein